MVNLSTCLFFLVSLEAVEASMGFHDWWMHEGFVMMQRAGSFVANLAHML